ncbi:MAG: asparagine synthase (glutamine-hydrolyzing) [Nitrospira sp.]|nr:asparagine synthase (glutamine-hydrolyzing) [Nitrospira sp.]
MCGIVGILSKNGQQVVQADIGRMAETLVHRGPDDYGLYCRGPLGLGHRRLSVIDLQTGSQPYHNEDKSVWAVFNGEIYNFHELRARLAAQGHVFHTAGDGEVIVHQYEEQAGAFLDGLNGMFAIALWDEKAQRLILARDRCGKKPVYYYESPTALVFASELKAILALPWIDRGVDAQGLHHFLSLNYVPDRFTLVRGIRKLLPGHMLIHEGGRTSLRSYWDLKIVPKRKMAEPDAVEELDGLLRSAVRSRLISDVPLGFFLSGGLDSSLVVALASAMSTAPIHTFSIGFNQPSYNELAYAREVSRRFQTVHHEEVIDSNPRDVLPRVIWLSDEPSGDSSSIPMYLISKAARAHITVALSGDGADELFAGYLTYQADRMAPFLRRVPAILRNGLLKPLADRLPVSLEKVSFEYRLKQFLGGLDMDPLRSHYWWNGAFSEAEKSGLYSDDLKAAVRSVDTRDVFAEYFDRYPELDPLTRLLYTDFKTYLPDDILVKVDRMSMGNSLEMRCPFLDHRLVQFVSDLPVHFKLKALTGKYLLKRYAESLLPRRILHRPKAGFSVPLNSWLRQELRELVEESLSERRIRATGYFAWPTVRRLLSEHMDGRQNHAYRLWAVLVFQLWHEMFIEKAPAC